MIPVQLNYAIPETLESAVQLLTEHKDAQILAGGHSLLIALKLGHVIPSVVVDLARIPGLQSIQPCQNGIFCIGAMTTYAETVVALEGYKVYQALVESVNCIGDAQIRNWGRIGDIFAYRDLACDLVAAFLVLGTTFSTVSQTGIRMIPAEQFFLTPVQFSLEVGEIVTSINLPLLNSAGNAYEVFKHPVSQYTLCGVASKVEQSSNGLIHNCRVATTGTAIPATRLYQIEAALEGQLPTAEIIASVIEQATSNMFIEQALSSSNNEDINSTNHYISFDYCIHLVKVLLERSLNRAIQQLKPS